MRRSHYHTEDERVNEFDTVTPKLKVQFVALDSICNEKKMLSVLHTATLAQWGIGNVPEEEI